MHKFLFFTLIFFQNIYSAEIIFSSKIIKADRKICESSSKMADEFLKELENNKFFPDLILYLREPDIEFKDRLIKKFSKILCSNKFFIANFGENNGQASEFIIRNLLENDFGDLADIFYSPAKITKFRLSVASNIYYSLLKIETADFFSF